MVVGFAQQDWSKTMALELTLDQQQAVIRLKEGFKHHDYFGAAPADSPVMILPHSHSGHSLFELPYDVGGGGQFSLGDLRMILSVFEGA